MVQYHQSAAMRKNISSPSCNSCPSRSGRCLQDQAEEWGFTGHIGSSEPETHPDTAKPDLRQLTPRHTAHRRCSWRQPALSPKLGRNLRENRTAGQQLDMCSFTRGKRMSPDRHVKQLVRWAWKHQKGSTYNPIPTTNGIHHKCAESGTVEAHTELASSMVVTKESLAAVVKRGRHASQK